MPIRMFGTIGVWDWFFKEDGPTLRQGEARVKHGPGLDCLGSHGVVVPSGRLFLPAEAVEDRGNHPGVLDHGDALHAAPRQILTAVVR